MVLEGGVIQWERVLGAGIVALVEDGRFDGVVQDYGGEVGLGAIVQLRGEVEVFAELNDEAFEGLARGYDDRVRH